MVNIPLFTRFSTAQLSWCRISSNNSMWKKWDMQKNPSWSWLFDLLQRMKSLPALIGSATFIHDVGIPYLPSSHFIFDWPLSKACQLDMLPWNTRTIGDFAHLFLCSRNNNYSMQRSSSFWSTSISLISFNTCLNRWMYRPQMVRSITPSPNCRC